MASRNIDDIISTAQDILNVCTDFGGTWEDGPAVDWQFLAELNTLLRVLHRTSKALKNDESKRLFDSDHSSFLRYFEKGEEFISTPEMMSECKQELDRILHDLARRVQGHRVGWQKFDVPFMGNKARVAMDNLRLRCERLNHHPLILRSLVPATLRTEKELAEALAVGPGECTHVLSACTLESRRLERTCYSSTLRSNEL
jgi:hypothetical protein